MSGTGSVIIIVIMVTIFTLMSQTGSRRGKYKNSKSVAQIWGDNVSEWLKNRDGGTDVTCETQYDHTHEQMNTSEYGKRYVVRPQVENGYVVLNGVKRKLTDCGML